MRTGGRLRDIGHRQHAEERRDRSGEFFPHRHAAGQWQKKILDAFQFHSVQYIAESQVNPVALVRRRLRQAVLPVMLQAPCHEQQAAIFQIQFEPCFVFVMAQTESPCVAKAQRGNAGVRSQFGFLVRMPAHRVTAVAVLIGQHAVETAAGVRLDLRPEFQQQRPPSRRHMPGTGIGINDTLRSVPADQPRYRHGPTGDPDRFLMPVQLAQQTPVYVFRLVVGDKTGEIIQLAVTGQQ